LSLGKRNLIIIFTFSLVFSTFAQKITPEKKQDTLSPIIKENQSPFHTGYYPIAFFDVNLRYLIKYNNYEGFRLGIGGVTNEMLFEKYKFGGYYARGFKDEKSKYSIGGSARLNKKTNTWLNVYYTSDIQEIGSYLYLTDKLLYTVFEPRLLNISQFYKHRNWQVNIQHQFSSKIISETRISHSNINQIIDYQYLNMENVFNNYKLVEASASIRIILKTNSFTTNKGVIEYYDGLPNISFQITQGIKGILKSDFNYTKFGLKLKYFLKRKDLSSTNIILNGSLALGDVPLTHLFHASPNSPTKDEILQRFSVAGRYSFETMYFGEFYSDRLITFHLKHSLRRFNISKTMQPELVFITRHALGDMINKENHLGVNFSTLDQFYSESGIEINKILFGFGLSFAYRYGFYNLPDFEDNISFKFTFYLKL